MVDLYNAKVRYDSDFDLLSIRKHGFKTTYSVSVGDIRIEFYGDRPIGLSVENAVEFLGRFASGPKINSEALSHVTNAKVGFLMAGNALYLMFAFKLPNHELFEARYGFPFVSKKAMAVLA